MPNCQNLAAEYLTSRGMRDSDRVIHYYNGEFWEWNGACYVSLGDEHRGVLRHRLNRWMRTQLDEFSKGTLDWTFENLVSTLRTESPPSMPSWLGDVKPRERNGRWVAVQNGLLDLSGPPSILPVLRTATPRWFSANVLPIQFSRTAKCPLWERCLSEWLEDNSAAIAFLQEFVGYCLTPDTRYHAALFLEGEGANGKGVFTDVVEQLIGPANCSSVKLDDWTKQYALADTLYKLVNFSTEVEEKTKLPCATLKSYISGDSMTVARKYLSGATTHPTARLIVSWNRRPIITDTSEGFWRRLYLVPFSVSFKDREDKNLLDKLRTELPGILNWAIRGHQRLYSTTTFTKVGAVAEAGAAFREERDPTRAFILTHLVSSPGKHLAKTTVWNRYTAWCESRGYEHGRDAEFARRLYQLIPGTHSERLRVNGNRVPFFTNVSFL